MQVSPVPPVHHTVHGDWSGKRFQYRTLVRLNKMLKKSILQALIGLTLFAIGCLELTAADDRFISTQWKRSQQAQQGSHWCDAKKLEDNSEEVSCTTEVQFTQKSPADYSNKLKTIESSLNQIESQFEDCQIENERKERLVNLQANLTDILHERLTESDITALETSWRSLTTGADGQSTFGVDLVLWMLTTVPNIRDRFTKFNAHQSDASLKSDAQFNRQVNLIVGGLRSLITSLRNPGQLLAAIERLADFHLHLKPSVGLEYFGPLKDNIGSYIEKALNASPDSAEPKAWARLLEAFNQVLDRYANLNIGLSDTDKVALETSWKKFIPTANDKKDAGIRLVLWMLNNIPNIRERFTKFNARLSDDALKVNPEFLRQVNVIIGGFETLIGNLNDSAILQDRLESLADSHLNKRPAIGNDYFGPLQKSINLFIANEIGVDSDSEEAEAWVHLVAALNKVIKDHAIHNLGLSDNDRESLVKSWNQLKARAGGSRNAGTNFVLWLLEDIPNMRDRFTKFNARLPNDVLRNDPEFVKQVALITRGLENLISNVNNPIAFKSTLASLAEAHLSLKPRIGLEYFAPLQQYVNRYIERTLNVAPDSDVSRAWSDLFASFNKVLKERTALRILSNEDRQALKSSWKKLTTQAGGLQNAGLNLVLWLLGEIPKMRDRFVKFNAHSSDDALRQSPEFVKQVNSIVGGIEGLINNVDDAEELQGSIERLVDAHLHMTPSVGLEYFGPLQKKISSYIQTALNVSPDSDEARAWTDLFSVFNEFLSEHTIEKIGLSTIDRKILESSWKTLTSGGKQQAGVKLVLWMFNNVPNMRDQFSKFNATKADDVLSQDSEFLKQVDNIVGGLDSLLNNLNRPGQLQSALEQLADYHLDKKPRVGLEFFGPLEKYIHLYIESALNVPTGSDESKAWTNLLGALNKVIRDHALERLGLTDRDRKALDDSWKKIRAAAGGRKKSGINLVLWMFRNVPNMSQRFSKFNASQQEAFLIRDPEFLKQVDSILGGIESLLTSINDPVQFKSAIERVADFHLSITPRVGIEYFGPLQEKIPKFIEGALGVDANSEEVKAWTHLLAAFNKVLKEHRNVKHKVIQKEYHNFKNLYVIKEYDGTFGTVLQIISETEKTALVSSWKTLTGGPGGIQSAGIDLVYWMLENVPGMPGRFKKFSAFQSKDDLKADAEFVKQVDRIVGGLDTLINNLDNAGRLQAAIDRLVDAHLNMRPSVGLEYFEPLQLKISSYIQTALGKPEDSVEARAWSHLLSAFNSVLKEDSLQKIGLSESNRKNLESTWQNLINREGGRQTVGTKLVLWLFDNVPKIRDRFTRFNAHQSEEALKNDLQFVKQVQVITGGIDSLISNVNNPAGLQAAIEKLVDAHLNMQPSVGLSYFGAVQKYIPLFIAKELEVSTSSDEATAWADLFAAFNKVLKEHSLEKIGISDNDRKALVGSWKRLTTEHGGTQNLGIDFVLWLFDKIPNIRDQFTKFNAQQTNDALRRDPEFVKQVDRIIGGLESLINKVNDPAELQRKLEKLVDIHLHFVPSVGIEFFKPLEEQIHEFIETELRVTADSAEAKAWTNLIAAFNKVLKDHTIQDIGISVNDRKTLGVSWKRLTGGENGVRNTGINLVLWMFNNVPNMRKRFTKFNATQSDDVLRTDAEFLKQVDLIIGGLESFLVNIDDPIQLQTNMDRVAEAHLSMTPAVGVDYFKVLAQNINSFIQSILLVGPDSDEVHAWTDLLAAFNKIVRNRTVLRKVSASDKAAFISSWDKLLAKFGGKRNAGIDLVLWMLNTVPNMRKKFTKFNADQPDAVLRNDPEFLKQVDRIVGGLESLERNINNPSRFLSALVTLSDAHLHMKPSVGLEFFEPLQQNIHTYIEQTLADAPGSEEPNAWTDVLGAFNEILRFNSIDKIGLSDSDTKALVDSWAELTTGGKQKAGIDLVLWMLKNIPNMRRRFSKFNAFAKDDELSGNEEFLKQVDLIVGGVDSLVNSVNQPAQLQANLEKLVDDHLHMTPNVGLQYFGPLQQYIHLYIESALKVSSSSFESQAWTNLFSAFNKVLREHSIKKIGLSDTDRKSLVSSWRRLVSQAGSRRDAGNNLVLWMLANVPKIRDKFLKFNAYLPDEALRNNNEFLRQVELIVGGVESLIDNVNNPSQFETALERLSAVHRNMSPSVGLEYFGPLQRYIHLYVAQALNVNPDSDEAQSWSNLFNSFNDVLKRW